MHLREFDCLCHFVRLSFILFTFCFESAAKLQQIVLICNIFVAKSPIIFM